MSADGVDGVEELEEKLSENLDRMNRELAQARGRITELEDENERLRQRVGDLMDRVTVLEDRERPEGKDARAAQLVEFADNLRDDGDDGAKLDVQDIRGATGVSRRYAYDLVDELPEEFAYIRDRKNVEQFGDAEIGGGGTESEPIGIYVDVEEAHRVEEDVNKFTTETAEGGGR